MKIIRNEEEFELTAEELNDAYHEQELRYICEDVREAIRQKGYALQKITEEDILQAAKKMIQLRDKSSSFFDPFWSLIEAGIEQSDIPLVHSDLYTFAEHIGFGSRIRDIYTGEVYCTVEDEFSRDTDGTECVAEKDYKQYLNLKSKEEIGALSEEEKKRLSAMVTYADAASFETADTVRFITPEYKTLFCVRNLGRVIVNGSEKRVVYLDPTHFTFTEGAGAFGCFHICQFAELVEKARWTVEPVEEDLAEDHRDRQNGSQFNI